MLIDVHEIRVGGGIGRLFEAIDRIPEQRKTGIWVEFDGESFPVKTGIRNFIALTSERLQEIECRRKGKGGRA
ncbi:hypothetical protein H7A76_32190 [Pseudomonas sp. MSSRFD41]|uniref:hypothetical protein n=1 Tax=Pseudomonas sp. MSSRFD41 TaxID=1310370 RepID=UPI00163A8907|nr:hypothetical protein [Pseudomonas sp. MSSRFD41]MBC2660113.1 hypothetical protein [Pseudomonas sp. MSSRFD41]